ICTVSKHLKEKKEALYNIKNIFELNNAIDSDLFSKTKENKIKYNYNKVVGFVGNIKNYIDFDLIIYLAKKRKDVQFVIIGFNPNEEIKNKTKELNNIIFEGNKKYEELPKYIKSFDIGIIPYKVDDTHIKSISPMKLYEYLACNIFVLSSPIPDVVNFKINSNMGTYVEIANNYNEFLEKLDSLIVRDKFQLTEEEIYTISWEKRFSDLFEELNKLGIIEYNKKS
ncbi:MAG: glycosyltransferase, partial [Candidatus Sericytochromatia bacterium]